MKCLILFNITANDMIVLVKTRPLVHMCACLYSYNMCDCMRMRLSLLLLGYGFDCRTQTRTHAYTNMVIVIGWKWIELHGNGRNELQTTSIWRARMSGIISVMIFCRCYRNVEKPLCYLNVHKNDIRQYGIICDMIFYDYFMFFALLFLFDDPITFQGCTDEISFLLYNELHQMLLKLLR